MTKCKHQPSYHWFWNESFWLPNKLRWKDLQSTSERTYGQPKDLLWAFPLALTLLATRSVFEHLIAKKIGMKLNIPDSSYKKPSQSIILEKVYTSFTKKPIPERVEGLGKHLDWNQKQVRRWFRRRRRIDHPSELEKFCRSAWRFLFYLVMTISGLILIHGENFVRDTRRFFSHYPRDHDLTLSYYRYYMLEMAFYFSSFFTLFFHVRRRGFSEMLLHHIATILLISGSYITNFTKIGVSIMLLHDCSDVFLELANIAKFSKCKRLKTASFFVLSAVFIVTRGLIFPGCILKSIATEGMVILKPFPNSLYLFAAALVFLQMLHLYWCNRILSAVCLLFCTRKMKVNSQSDTESSSDDID